MTAARKPRSRAATALALLVGTGGAAFCIGAVHRTAQAPVGDGSGMQWVILAPLGLLLLGLVIPALIYGIGGIREALAATPPATVRQQEGRAFRFLGIFAAFLLLIAFVVLPILVTVLLAVLE